MNSRDHLAYRGMLAVTVILPVAGMIFAFFDRWTLATICAGLWMIICAGLVHVQTRVLNSGARALRDSVAKRGSTATDTSALLGRLDSISEDLAMVRARAASEPTQDEVRADVVQLAHSLRREVRFLQYSLAVSDETTSVPASASETN